jgi:hypothetical protein
VKAANRTSVVGKSTIFWGSLGAILAAAVILAAVGGFLSLSRQMLTRRPMPLVDAGHVRGFELVTPPFVGAAVGGVILHVKKGITERRVPGDVVSGRAAKTATKKP